MIPIMGLILGNQSIGLIKLRFFGMRALTYFGFLLIPVWMSKIVGFNSAGKTFILSFYIFFMMGQWFLLGKEIDHRFKIYFKVNSSLERVLYRILLGKTVIILLFQILGFINKDLVNHFFWGIWVVLGIFYSWPTRGKIIQETISSELSEYRFLDSFERTVLLLIGMFFLLSYPELPLFSSLDALKLYFDPFSSISNQYWKFMELQYFPFLKKPEILKIAFASHFYLVGGTIFLTASYCLFREFFSRRLSILGVFALVTSWSFSKVISTLPGHPLLAMWTVAWFWSLIWIPRSGTYRLGLVIGLLAYWGVLIDKNLLYLIVINFLSMIYALPEDKNYWFKRQLVKYSGFGLALSLVSYFGRWEQDNLFYILKKDSWFEHLMEIFERKGFFILAPLGIALMITKMIKLNREPFKNFIMDPNQIGRLSILFLGAGIFSLFWGTFVIEGYVIMTALTFLSLLPIEWLFQSLSRVRNRRNLIFAIYLFILVLDSHFEGRVKIFLKLFFT